MENFLIYLLKVAVLIIVMFALYKLLLGNETFYRFNRIILLTMAMLSFVLPLCNISQYLEKLNSVITTDALKTLTGVDVTNTPDDAPFNAPINSPVIFADNTQGIANIESNTQAIPESSSPSGYKNILMHILMIVYCAVFVLILIKKTISVLSIAKVIKKGRYANRLDGCDVIESDRIRQPLNWMKYIVMPKEWLDKNNSAVWQHENLHARKWHSVDLLISDLMTAFQWFNPVMILFHKELALIHEYEADHAVIDSGADVHEYKLMLVNAVASSRGFGMTSWLKQSNLKNRIDMMNRTKSNGWNKLKALFIPLLAGLFLLVNSTMAYAQIVTSNPAESVDGTGSHEQLSSNFAVVQEARPLADFHINFPVEEIPKGEFKSCTAIIVDDNSVTQIKLKGISFDGKGSMTVSGDKLGLLLGDGTHSVSLGDKVDNNQNKFVIKSNSKEQEFLFSKLLYGTTFGEMEEDGYSLKKMDGNKIEYQIFIQNN